MNKDVIKKIAQLAIADGKINQTVKDYVLKKLSKKDLKTFLFYLKNEFKKNKVYVMIADIPNDQTIKYMSRIFEGKNIEFKIDSSLGGGIKMEYEDNIIDISLKSLINQSINKIKNSI